MSDGWRRNPGIPDLRTNAACNSKVQNTATGVPERVPMVLERKMLFSVCHIPATAVWAL